MAGTNPARWMPTTGPQWLKWIFIMVTGHIRWPIYKLLQKACPPNVQFLKSIISPASVGNAMDCSFFSKCFCRIFPASSSWTQRYLLSSFRSNSWTWKVGVHDEVSWRLLIKSVSKCDSQTLRHIASALHHAPPPPRFHRASHLAICTTNGHLLSIALNGQTQERISWERGKCRYKTTPPVRFMLYIQNVSRHPNYLVN